MSSEQIKKVGGVGRQEATGLFPEEVIAIWQKEHFLFGKVPAQRYDLADPAMQQLIGSVSAMGWEQPGIIYHFEDTKQSHVICGNRRTFAQGIINAERLAEDKDPARGSYRIVIKKTCGQKEMIEALELYADTNNTAKGNDWLTVAGAAAHQLKIGVSVAAVIARWPMIESEAMLDQLAADNGVRAACPELQTALASGLIPVRRAIRIAKLPLSEQAAAMNGKREKVAKVPATVSLTKLAKVREALRDDKRLDGMTARDLLDILCGSAVVNEASLVVGQIIVAKGKPGRKPTQPAKQDGLTGEERAGTQAFLDAEAKKREEEEAAQRK